MGSSLPLRTALRLALREIAASRSRFLFIACAVAVGVGSLAGVRGFARSFRTMLLAEARTLMAADLMVRAFEDASPEQLAVIQRLEARGARLTRITETISVTSSGSHGPALVSVKAVDPSVYPFYGTVQLDPPQPLSAALHDDTVAVSDDLLLRLNLARGDSLRLGEADFRITAVVLSEPDRMTGSLNVGPRVMITREALARTGLMKPGSRASQRFLFRFDPIRLSVVAARLELARAFPGARIADFREIHPLISRGLNRSERFLSLVCLIALIVGALGVAATMHAHLQQRLDTIAIMKCLGARSSQILRLYLLQTVLVGVTGGLLGCVVGGAVQASFPRLIARYFALTPRFQFDPRAALEAVAVGLLTALLFTWPALLGIRRIRPAVIFRRDLAQTGDGWRRRWLTPAPWLAGGMIVVGLGAIATYLAGGLSERAAQTGGFFVVGLLVALPSLAGVAWALLRAIRLLLRSPRWKLPAILRHGLANVHRPGNQAQAVLVALGIGVMFTLSVLLIQRGLLTTIFDSAPPDMPNVFLLNITSREHEGMNKLLKAQPALGRKPELIPVVIARLRTIDGDTLGDQGRGRNWRRTSSSRAVSWRAAPGPRTKVISGRWWDSKPAQGELCIEQDWARSLGAEPGTRTTWSVGAQKFEATVVCTFETEEVRFSGDMDIVFSPGTLDGFPVQYFGSLRMRPNDVAAFQRAAFARFPSVTVINAADVIDIIQQVVDQIALVVRFISMFAILAGVIILASSVAATRFRRIKEVAILKTLGASRRRVAAIFSIEFLVIGAAAGILGSLLATGFSNLLMTRLLEGNARVDAIPNLAAVALTAVLAVGAGWLAGHRILARKPLEVLRHE